MRSLPPLLCSACIALTLISLLLTRSASQCIPPTPLSTSLYSSSDCMWNGFDFSPLAANDLYGTDSSGAMSVFRLCGAVSDPVCSAASGGSGQLCKWATNASTSPACSPLNVTLTNTAGYNFSYINASQPYTGGVAVTIYPSTPALCNGAPAVVVVNLLCSSTAPAVPVNQLDSATKVTVSSCPCTTTITLRTSLACAAPPQTGSSSSSTGGVSAAVVGSSSSSTGGSYSSTSSPASSSSSSSSFQCLSNPFGLDLSSLSNELHYQSLTDSRQWSVSLCGEVTDSYCRLFAPHTSVCGYSICNPWSSRSTMNYASVLTAATNYAWRLTDGVNASNGVEYLQMNGQLNGDSRQQMVVRLVCDPTATSAYIGSVSVNTNTVTVVIRTNLTCSLVVTDPRYLCPSGCCGLGYDFTALNYDVYGYSPSYAVWGLRMCGSMNSSICTGASACQNAACGASVDQPGSGSVMSKWQPSLQSWSYINGRDYTGGVQMVTVNGQACGSGTGRTVVVARFLCDTAALHPNDFKVVQTGQCVYNITLYTAIVCAAPSLTSSALVVSQPLPAVPTVFGCQFAGYDLSPLSAYDMKLPYQGYMFDTRVCGQVNDRATQLDPYMRNASVVQVAMGCGGLYTQYLVSVWNPYLASTAIVNGNVAVTVVDGSTLYCGQPRGLKWIFKCDPTAHYARLYSVVEEFGVNNCHYDLTILTDRVCGAANNGSGASGGTLLLGSSSTGQSRLFNGTDNGAGSVRGSGAWVGVVVACAVALLSVVLPMQ